MSIDLRQASLDEFIQFVFDHPVPSDKDTPEWYFEDALEIEYEPIKQIRLMTSLFRSASLLAERFSPAQIEQGFWLVFNTVEECFTNLLWASQVPWSERKACIEAVSVLYSDLFPRVKVETIDYMIPDLLADSYGHGRRDTENNPEDKRVQDALFELFLVLLDSRDQGSHFAGLHGLGHLHHPNGPHAIEGYLGRTPAVSEELRAYAAQAMTGNVL
jgi:hypothetical protein